MQKETIGEFIATFMLFGLPTALIIGGLLQWI